MVYHTLEPPVVVKPRSSKYRLKRAWWMAVMAPRPMLTVGNSQKSGIKRG